MEQEDYYYDALDPKKRFIRAASLNDLSWQGRYVVRIEHEMLETPIGVSRHLQHINRIRINLKSTREPLLFIQIDKGEDITHLYIYYGSFTTNISSFLLKRELESPFSQKNITLSTAQSSRGAIRSE